MFEYVGAIHMHSVFSDGSGQVDEIAGFASEAGLDYIILTDHNTLRALKEGYEGWYGETLLLVGCELNDKENKNHYLAFGIEEAYSTRYTAQEYINLVNEAGGIGFIAHPHEKRAHMPEHQAYPWTDWEADGFTGIEIWNHMSEWMENLTEQNKYQAFLHPLRSIVGPQEETLRVWDELSLKRKVVGIGGVDAHAHKYNLLGFLEVEIFPYKVLFKSIRTHILSSEPIKSDDGQTSPSHAKNVIYNSLKNGSCFFANDYHGDSTGFRFTAELNDRIYQQGSEIPFNDQILIKVQVPNEKARITILQNGKEVNVTSGKTAEFIPTEKGVYRVEVTINQKAWIYSNHIRIGV